MTSSTNGTENETGMLIAGTDGKPPSSRSDGGETSSNVAASPFWAFSSAPKDRKKSGFSPLVAFCFAINYILGTGFLTIPWAFVQGGLALSSILLITVCIFADASKDFLLETMARAEAMLDTNMGWKSAESKKNIGKGLVYSPRISRENSIGYDMIEDGSSKSAALSQSKVIKCYDSLSTIRPPPNNAIYSEPHTPKSNKARFQGRKLIQKEMKVPEYTVKNRKFEVNTLCRVFLGKQGLRVYTVFVCLYIYGALWAYTSVFANSMSQALPLLPGLSNDTNYGIYTVIFAIVVIPMSCLEMDEQVGVQVFLTACRFLMVFLMISTSWTCAEDTGVAAQNDINPGSEAENANDAQMFSFSNMHKMLPIVVFATIYHHSIPGLSHPVADKKQLSGIFLSTCAFSGVAYSVIGFILGSAFGESVKQSANLNWKGFRGGTGVLTEEGIYVDVAPWAVAVSSFILCFPALDVVSAFPLNAITLGNNLMGAFHGNNVHEIEADRWKVIQFRLVACIPPLVGGFLVRELGVITDFAGTTGFAITFSFPALLFIYSKKEAIQRKFSSTTFYTSHASSDAFAYFLFFFGISMVIFVLIQLIAD